MDEAIARMRADRLGAWQRLRELASRPFDLRGGLTPERIATMRTGAAGLELLYATERLDEATLEALQALADEARAVEQFEMMMRGEVMNKIVGFPSECRRVLHTASRNVFDDLPSPCDAGQADATAKAGAQLERLKVFLDELESGKLVNERGETFTDMVQVGIGGSDLGPRALYLALEEWWLAGRRVHFVSNVDPDDAARVLRRVPDLSRTLVNVVSKGGTTLETLTNERLVAAEFERAGLEPRRHFVSVTAEGSPMDDPERYLRSFHMFDYIGGRYSATSMVGGVALGFGLGYERFREILRGARLMDLNALERDARKNLALLAALIGIWNRNFLGYESLAILPYSQSLSRFVAHLQQLDMESNGKRVSRSGEALPYATGPIVWGEPGTNGQHAFYQLLHQSETVAPVEFIGFRRSQSGFDLAVEGTTSQEKLLANLLAQARAFAEGKDDDNPNKFFPGNRPSLIVMGQRLDPTTMGALLAFYENKVAFQGFIWNINSFDQEGVQLGKVLARGFIAHFRAMREDPDYDGSQADPIGWAMLRAAGLTKTL